MKNLLKRLIRAAGYDVRRFQPSSSEAAQLRTLLRHHAINVVLDIGANEGQYALLLRQLGYKGRIISFEPLSAVHAKLVKASRGNADWIIAPRTALGSVTGQAQINVTANSFSSSLLPMNELHTSFAPASAYVGKETVPLARLDDVGAGYLNNESIAFLKIDAQGYTHEVLAGAPALLRKVAGLQVELSVVSLYEGEKLLMEMVPALERSGLKLWALQPAFIDNSTGRLLQVDAIFFAARSS